MKELLTETTSGDSFIHVKTEKYLSPQEDQPLMPSRYLHMALRAGQDHLFLHWIPGGLHSAQDIIPNPLRSPHQGTQLLTSSHYCFLSFSN